ncbi:MAG TPA: glycoside hydrolase family 38 C-terminal domain-containing protein [Tepidisphaeraceae bacterium]|jgi:alpha-mannosidase|nr:glycoside hydrolase family 38 C-terminal domain-containing protein [Tepidisphaeraceae bacterium]
MRRFNRLMIVSLAAAAALCSTYAKGADASADTCLMFAARNISNPGPNFYLYYTFSNQGLDIKKGDVLEYDIYLSPTNPMAGGGIDFDTTGNVSLRDTQSEDQNHLRAHPNTSLPQATGHWYHREISLEKLVGRHATKWNLAAEGDQRGGYIQFFDNIDVAHADGTKSVIYDNGEPAARAMAQKEGYSQTVLLKPVDRALIKDGGDVTNVVDGELKRFALQSQLDEVRAEIELARKMADRAKDLHLEQHVNEAMAIVEHAEKDESLDAETLQSMIHEIHGSLNHTHPEMQKYTGHLVGHAHIDFQWLWEWTETIQVCHDTFNQALKFMKEFPGFSFSQSSAALYACTEQHWPEVFKGIQEEVAAGHWEIVGGRVCEGDEHMISPESHAMHFLYGQRYFRERFNGKQAIVGWEPDTFGHTLQFPQILNLGGCKYFYFCRGGYNHPMFWWQAPDGSRVLAFEEPATGGWYNGDISTNRFDRLFKFADETGAKDMLEVYGVGNHGGGPTRENINAALAFQKVPFLPTLKFSTATEFFHSLEKYDLTKLYVHTTDLNTPANTVNDKGLYGTYTTHSDLKRWNRDAESLTESAEAIAAFAARFGYDYPGKEFRKNWEDICWNHHHDTLTGTSIHPSYNLSEKMFTRVIASSKKIGEDALAFLATKVKSDDDSVLVFNPVGWTTSAMVKLPANVPAGSIATAEGDSAAMQQSSDDHSIFYASNLPSYGYRVYHIKSGKAESEGVPTVSGDFKTLENAEYKVVFDPSRAVVTSVIEKKSGHEFVAPGGSIDRLEIHWEQPDGMSAWIIGTIDHVDALTSPVTPKITEEGPARVTIAWDRTFKSTTLHQTLSMPAHGAPEFTLDTQWKEIGSAKELIPFLKVAFDINATNPVATYQVPFASITKPTDGGERPALKFADLSDETSGAAIVQDCKQGYSAKGHTMFLSLIRTSFYPDPRPNDRPQHAKWAFLPHMGSWQSAGVLNYAESFNHPLMATAVKANADGTLPAEASFLSVGNNPNIIITGVKQAEDDKDLVVRLYEAYGTAAQPTITLPFAPKHLQLVNFMEDHLANQESATLSVKPHQIQNVKMVLSDEAQFAK